MEQGQQQQQQQAGDDWASTPRKVDDLNSFPVKREFQAEHKRRECENLAGLNEYLRIVDESVKPTVFNVAQVQNAIVPFAHWNNGADPDFVIFDAEAEVCLEAAMAALPSSLVQLDSQSELNETKAKIRDQKKTISTLKKKNSDLLYTNKIILILLLALAVGTAILSFWLFYVSRSADQMAWALDYFWTNN